MDVIALNIFADVPIVTKCWTIGCITVLILTSLNLIDPAKLIYSYDLVFKKGQYHRILLSVFNYGTLTWATIGNILISANHLSFLESSYNERRRFIWLITVLLTLIITMTRYFLPMSSLGMILHENLLNFHFKKHAEEMNGGGIAGFIIAAPLLPYLMYFNMYFSQGLSLLEISINFLPAHLIYYLDDIVGKLYDVDLMKPPYDMWLSFQNWRLKDNTNNELSIDNNEQVN
ncbi:similar to Saccharomyces cerevisiae YBR201W DER1 Endoplasmic reticulum membrane protein, required for ER-associated protein degradation of misfolded or unassembled proteins [Maudiozyma saulgeensis]|uniref:Derlin n=1 Tax=Maudiozyma saulgeensis TaxID=1789683 RepID=A0A1X7R1S0_9SACH|nr:similar to Saccharomyces cerevisiae YBR201W DER1 Endoplasmic reticulum membrane protein, required for ER-associated protein degradation of misfolded or unassembled proteins [Kazachstania saulgeensis]